MAAAREIVISVRLDRGSVHVLDLLIGSGVARSRSEATARLVQIGIGASSKLLEAAKEIANKARRLRDEFGSPDEAYDESYVENDEHLGQGEDGEDRGDGEDGEDGAERGVESAGAIEADSGKNDENDAEVEAFLRPYREAVEKYRATSEDEALDPFQAATLAEPYLIQTLLKEAPDLVHRHDESGWTPLHLAALFKRPRTVSALLGAGADPDVKSDNWLAATPLHAAALRGDVDAVDTLMLRRADVNARQSNGWTPLHIAAFTGYGWLVDTLLKWGADPSIRSVKGETPFDIAMANGRSQLARRLLAH